MEQNNVIRVNLGSSANEQLYISTNDIHQSISAVNNRAEDFAQDAKNYMNAAKNYMDKSKEYMDTAESISKQNSNLAMDYIDSVENELTESMDGISSQLDTKASMEYVNEIKNELEETIQDGLLPLDTKATINYVNDVKNELVEYVDESISSADSGVTSGYVDNVKNEIIEYVDGSLENYALITNIPTNVSQLSNDAEYINETTLEDAISEIKLPSQEGKAGLFLQTNGESVSWNTANTFSLFDTKISDFILNNEESKGWALQGTYVYKQAIAGSRYGYPDFYAKCLEERNTATATQVTLGDSTITMYVASNGHQYYDIANKDVVDTFLGTMGTAWFYGVDTENERIFLPRNNFFDQLTGDTTEVGQSVEAGLPNIKGTAQFGDSNNGGTGESTLGGVSLHRDSDNLWYRDTEWALGKNIRAGNESDDGNYSYGIGFDASRTNNIYGNSDTVQPPAVKKLLYICVGNTESVSSVTDVVDVTTTQNDTIPLFTGMYFDFIPNNPSWLVGGGQANSGGIYKTCYNELVNVLNGETKYGDLKVVDTTKMISGVDYSEYWKVNQTNMTFTTPTAISSKSYNDIAPVVGNGIAIGLTDGTNLTGMFATGSNIAAPLGSNDSMYGKAVGTAPGSGYSNSGKSVGLTSDSAKSGIEAHLVENTNAQLYFKVANAVQNLELLNVGEVLEAVADKISRQDCLAYITETYVNGTSWYRVYSDGWCEQGGRGTYTSTSSVNLIKSYTDTNYNISIAQIGGSSNYEFNNVYNLTVNSFNASLHTSSGGTNTQTISWRTFGYIR